jgi:hypothetical protein
MKTVNSLSGGKTSSYIAANYPADYNVFALVRTDDKECIFPDAKIRQIVSDRIDTEFIGTLEMDEIIYTMLDLEQFIGQEIHWVSPITFDKVLQRWGTDKLYLPNKVQRFCTVDMKIKPIFYWWAKTLNFETCEMRIGFRANEMKRAKSMIERLDENGIGWEKGTWEKSTNGRNIWKNVPYRKLSFPLIEDKIFKDEVDQFWKNKPVRFAYMNNCVGCFHRNPILLKHMSNKAENKFNWFMNKETQKDRVSTWRNDITYKKIKESLTQLQLFDDDFNECDSGYCGL